MSYWNGFSSLGHPLSCADFIDCMKNVGAVVSVSTPIADSDYHIFQDDESVLVFERLPLNSPRLHRAFAIFTAISVHSPDSSACGAASRLRAGFQGGLSPCRTVCCPAKLRPESHRW